MEAQAPRPSAVARVMSGVSRVRRAWRGLAREQRFAATAALALFITMLLPWYSVQLGVKGGQLVTDHQSALQAFSFVEAAVLLTALSVLWILFARGERRAFHLPGGDGAVITAAGVWTAVLIVWRLFDRPDLGRGVAVGIAWGIFVALVAAGMLAYAGRRVVAAHRPEPALPATRRRRRGAAAHRRPQRVWCGSRGAASPGRDAGARRPAGAARRWRGAPGPGADARARRRAHRAPAPRLAVPPGSPTDARGREWPIASRRASFSATRGPATSRVA